MNRRFQFTLADGFLLTAMAAALTATLATGESVVSFITLSCLLAFVWHRPVIMRLWATATMGLGSGIFAAMIYRAMGDRQYLSDFRMYTEQLAGWGAGLFVGALVAYRAFIVNPPACTKNQLHNEDVMTEK